MLEGWNAIFVGEIPGIAPLLARAAERLPLYALSNTNPPHIAHFSNAYADVLSHFRELYLSSTIGLLKPDAAAYDHVVEAIGMPASRVLFFDDLAENVEGARARGLNAVQVRSSDDVAIRSPRSGFRLWKPSLRGARRRSNPSTVIPGWCASTRPGISRFQVRCSPRNDEVWIASLRSQ